MHVPDPVDPDDHPEHVIALCIGRLLQLGSRPEQPGDIAEYHRIRTLALDAAERVPHLRARLTQW